MERFRSPEVLPNYPEFRPELEPERDMCLKSLLAQAEGRTHGDYDREADSYLIEGINNAVVEADEDRGEYKLACQQSGCEANCVMVLRSSGSEGTITVDDPQSLEDCLYEQ
jgi:hypothetical protein